MVRSRLRHPRSKSNAGPVEKAPKSTAESANREKSSKLAFEPDQSSSPVDLGVPDSGQMRVFHAANERIPKPEDSLAEQDGFELSGDFVSGP
jgi:hypothetical protein